MSEWMEMKTAPTDTRVEVGRYDEWRDVTEWKTTAGTCYERFLFWRRKTYYAKEYSHWRPLPPPPSKAK